MRGTARTPNLTARPCPFSGRLLPWLWPPCPSTGSDLSEHRGSSHPGGGLAVKAGGRVVDWRSCLRGGNSDGRLFVAAGRPHEHSLCWGRVDHRSLLPEMTAKSCLCWDHLPASSGGESNTSGIVSAQAPRAQDQDPLAASFGPPSDEAWPRAVVEHLSDIILVGSGPLLGAECHRAWRIISPALAIVQVPRSRKRRPRACPR